MSAAAPLPYPNTGPPPPSSGFNNGGERVFDHIDDLKAKAANGYDPQSSIRQLVKDAEVAVKQADFLLTTKRPDLAFVEYIRASEIAINVIPRHHDYVDFTHDQQEAAQRLRVLVKKVGAGEEQFARIKQIIVNNNSRSGARPKGAAQNIYGNGHVRTESAPAAQLQNGVASGGPVSGVHRKPTPSPKPEKLHGRAISHATNGSVNGASGPSDALSQRFAALRTLDTQQQPRPDSRASNASTVTSVHSSPIRSSPHPVSMPSVGDYNGGRSSFDALSRTTSITSKPQGPRGMPNGAMPPPLAIPNMPQAPQAAYSPARNMETPGDIAPPRHSARSLASTSTRRTSMATSSASSYAPNGGHSSQSNDYFPVMAPNGGRPTAPSHPQRRVSVNVPAETEVPPERLYDYLPRYHVLLIDFRSRAEFDEGHMYSRNVMCIEPDVLRQGMSAEELQERLVLSPEDEQNMFFHRDQYDFVVYYDSSTDSEESFLRHPIGENQVMMKYLHEALVEFNQDKPLQRPPILLQGGLTAWADMMGEQALISSKTLAQVKAARPIQRRPPATVIHGSNSELRVGKRSRRDFNPFNPEEEQLWREKARAESVVLQQPPDLSEDGLQEAAEVEERDGAEPESAIREFLERFPEAGNLDRQAFASQKPKREAPEVPAKVPMYPPVAPSPAVYPPPQIQGPQVPRRPAPAAPRMSYQGVSDRQVSGGGSTQAASTSRNLTPYIPPKFLAMNIRLPRTGLVNFRNTCYMNSMIQALSATTPLSVFFMDDGYRSQLQRENWKGSRGQMADHYANLIRNLWKGDVEVVKPTTFRSLVRRLAPSTFDNDDQQDAKELFDTVVDFLHEDMNAHWSRTPLRMLTEVEEAKRERMPRNIVAKTEWGRYIHRDLSFIHGLFAGQHASKLTCLECQFTSTTYETFTSISVEIPTDSRAWSNGRFPSLDDCLRSYCSEERLTRDDQWRCPRCKTFREAKKRITLTRAPQFLVIHFKRFANQGRQSRKIRIPVDFPLNNLDLGPYMLPPPTPEEAEYIAKAYHDQIPPNDASMTPPYTYDAYAVVRHLGATMQSGHYITAAKDQGRRCWHMFDDSRVSDFQPEQLRGGEALQSEQAYIVFYQRVNGGSGSGMGQGYGGKM